MNQMNVSVFLKMLMDTIDFKQLFEDRYDFLFILLFFILFILVIFLI